MARSAGRLAPHGSTGRDSRRALRIGFPGGAICESGSGGSIAIDSTGTAGNRAEDSGSRSAQSSRYRAAGSAHKPARGTNGGVAAGEELRRGCALGFICQMSNVPCQTSNVLVKLPNDQLTRLPNLRTVPQVEK